MITVLEMAIERIKTAYLLHDEVVVSYSGGKDSTVVLELAIQVARELNRLPVKTYFIDQEAIAPETEELVKITAARPEVDMKWICFPIVHRNASSFLEPYWFPWHPKDKDKWVRPIPQSALSLDNQLGDIPYPLHYPYLFPFLLNNTKKRYCILRGIRIEESLKRRQVVLGARKLGMGLDDFINYYSEFSFFKWSDRKQFQEVPRYFAHILQANPIYDFSVDDVWLYHYKYCTNYNKSYDLQHLAGMSYKQQRICQPLAEESTLNIDNLWRKSHGEMYDKLADRVNGVDTAARYVKTALFSRKFDENLDYRKEIIRILKLHPPESRVAMIKGIKEIIAKHKRKTARPLGDSMDLLTGVGYRNFYVGVKRGDVENRYINQYTMRVNSEEMDVAGVTLKELKALSNKKIDYSNHAELKMLDRLKFT